MSKLTPFIKWPGGKKWLVPHINRILPLSYNNYFEPFIGGGAVFFHLNPEKAVISDANADLINLYEVMRDYPCELRQQLLLHQKKHNTEYYYSIRGQEFKDDIEKAGRLLYLNRSCYNGMYRVNKSGKFNVPIGSKTNFIYDIDLFESYSSLLQRAKILNTDYSEVICLSRESDMIFVDPPYTTTKDQTTFIKYNEKLFTWSDQENLLQSLISAKNRGVQIIVTNANYKMIFDMYTDNGFNVEIMKRFCPIAGESARRSDIEELLITSFPI